MIETTTTVATARTKWSNAASGVPMGRAILSSFQRIGLQLQRTIMGSASGLKLKKRTGNLSRAIFYRVEGSPTSREILVRAGVDLSKAVYGRIHEHGGVIRPKRSKFLTIPVGQNVTPNGVVRVNAREFISNPGSLGFTGSFVNRSKTAIMGVLADGQIEPVFALKTQVTIRKTGYVSSSLGKNTSFIQAQLKVIGAEFAQEMRDGTN